MSDKPEHGEESIEELRQRFSELQAEHRHLKMEYARFKLGMRLLSRSFTSFGLPRRLREYQEVASLENPFPSPQTENLAASLMNRVIIGTLFTLVAGFGTLTLLVFQTYYLAQHAETLQSQARILERQVAQQQETTDRIRRSELADKLFNAECFPDFRESSCADVRHVIADTSSALEEYIEAERRRLNLSFNPNWREEEVSPCAGLAFDKHGRASDRLVNLRNVKLTISNPDIDLGMSLPGVDLTCIDFTGSDLQHADLTGADLSGSRLFRTNLADSKLEQINVLDTQGIPTMNLEGAKLETLINPYCDDLKALSTLLKTEIEAKDSCNEADKNRLRGY
ncbi:MAG: pentapeptide repeat-containing protein [Salinisphaeraceae bacterium]|nr:pentapeptide repeat-containing protein [Salinisphaeraceae bacterium]